MSILSFDIGGTKIASAEIENDGKICEEVKIVPTPKNAEGIADLIQKTASAGTFDGLAVATAGVVFENKVQGKPTNLPSGYENIDFAKLTGLKTAIINDANAAICAENQCGRLKNCRNAAMLTLGTGVGCGLILNGELYEGKIGAAGEVLFPVAGCDLAELAQENGLAIIDCFAIKAASESGNKTAIEVLHLWQKRLIDAIVLLNQVLDLEAVVLGGSLAKIVDYNAVEKAVNEIMRRNPLLVMQAEFENNAGLVGAAFWWRKCHG